MGQFLTIVSDENTASTTLSDSSCLPASPSAVYQGDMYLAEDAGRVTGRGIENARDDDLRQLLASLA